MFSISLGEDWIFFLLITIVGHGPRITQLKFMSAPSVISFVCTRFAQVSSQEAENSAQRFPNICLLSKVDAAVE
jgi:hypothetical protein